MLESVVKSLGTGLQLLGNSLQRIDWGRFIAVVFTYCFYALIKASVFGLVKFDCDLVESQFLCLASWLGFLDRSLVHAFTSEERRLLLLVSFMSSLCDDRIGCVFILSLVLARFTILLSWFVIILGRSHLEEVVFVLDCLLASFAEVEVLTLTACIPNSFDLVATAVTIEHRCRLLNSTTGLLLNYFREYVMYLASYLFLDQVLYSFEGYFSIFLLFARFWLSWFSLFPRPYLRFREFN